MRYLREYADWQKDEAQRIIEKQAEINERKVVLEKSRAEKQMLVTEREKENKKIEEEEKLQQKEVSEINKKQKQLQQQLQQQKKEADALLKQIERLIAEDMENYGKKDAATSSSGYVMEEKDVRLSANFENNKGKLPPPLSGKYTIISRFGEQQHHELAHVRTNNNGIDIQTTAGAEARSIFNGVVTRVFVMPGFNNNVIVRHGNYLSVYSNLSQVYVKAGDQVTTRQSLGKIFTDTQSGNETILHFQLWKENTKLNPQVWIQR
jgi:septal ring factor EnvC (AmiA/AmiB activator)